MKYRVIDENDVVIGVVDFFQPASEIEPELSGTKVALVVGHQEDRQGAYGDMGIGEWEYNTDLINKIMGTPSNGQVCAVFQRNKKITSYTEQMIDLHQRIDAWGAKISIEFHFNSFDNPDVEGHEVLYCSISVDAEKEAKALNACLDAHLPTSNRGAKSVTLNKRGGGFCCRGLSYALIIEPYFAVNQHDFVKGGKYRESLVTAINEYIANV